MKRRIGQSTMIGIIVLLALLPHASVGWIIPTTASVRRASPTRLFASDDPSQSRREVFQGLTKKAVIGLGLPLLPAHQANAIPSVVTSKSVCDPSVSVWKRDEERLVYILGTAHISEVSAALAGSLIQDTHPNAVFVELDLKRVGGIVRQSQDKMLPAASTDAAEYTSTSVAPVESPTMRIVVPAVASAQAVALTSPDEEALPPPPEPRGFRGWIQRKAFNFASNAVGKALKGMYSNLDQAGFSPGEEFSTAIREGQKIGASIVLGDQDVEYTLRRLTQALAATDLDKLLNPDAEFERTMQELLPGGPDSLQPDAKNYDDPAKFKQDLTEYVERLKSRESVRKIMSQLNEVAPALVQVMLTERDAYMATGIDTLNQFECIVAVMGIAHQDGVEKNLRQKGWKQVRLRCSSV